MNRENALRFYSGSGDEGHLGYCSRYRAIVLSDAVHLLIQSKMTGKNNFNFHFYKD